MLAIVLVIWMRKRHMGKMQFDQCDADLKDPTTSDPFYAEVNKDSLLPSLISMTRKWEVIQRSTLHTH